MSISRLERDVEIGLLFEQASIPRIKWRIRIQHNRIDSSDLHFHVAELGLLTSIFTESLRENAILITRELYSIDVMQSVSVAF